MPSATGRTAPPALYTYRATDPERTAITWSVSGTDVNAFQISETGTLALGTPPDFDEPTDAGGDNIYMVTVTATGHRLECRDVQRDGHRYRRERGA